MDSGFKLHFVNASYTEVDPWRALACVAIKQNIGASRDASKLSLNRYMVNDNPELQWIIMDNGFRCRFNIQSSIISCLPVDECFS